MHGPATILIMAKKKAAGPSGYFDPMGGAEDMAMGPMDAEMPAGGMFDAGGEYGEAMPAGSIQEALMHLRKAAQVLEGCEPESGPDAVAKAEAEAEDEDETTEEEPMPEPKAKAKKPVPAFLKPKPMKY
jgi:hypothetical protein